MTDFTDTLKELRRKLRTRENGPASEAMEKLGIKYNRNHGLAVREIKEIAQNYKYNHKLALELHFKDIRELVLMSFMIENPEQRKQMAKKSKQWSTRLEPEKYYSKLFEYLTKEENEKRVINLLK